MYYKILCVSIVLRIISAFLKRKSFEAAYAKGLSAATFSKVIKGEKLYYLSHEVIKCIRIISAICCKLIHYFILTGELVLNPLTG